MSIAVAARGQGVWVTGLAVAVAVLALALGFEWWVLQGAEPDTPRPQPVVLTPFLDLRVEWNRGISYSFFRADTPFGRAVLIGVAIVGLVVLGVWLARTRRPLVAAALGLLIGGALANVWDRFIHGAVADFFHLHWGGFAPFGVFNIADMAITAGVAVLLWAELRKSNSEPNKRGPG